MSAAWAGASYGIQTEEERKLGMNVEKVEHTELLGREVIPCDTTVADTRHYSFINTHSM